MIKIEKGRYCGGCSDFESGPLYKIIDDYCPKCKKDFQTWPELDDVVNKISDRKLKEYNKKLC